MKDVSDKEWQNLCNSDDAIDHNFDLGTHENDDYSEQALFVDEDWWDYNESRDEDTTLFVIHLLWFPAIYPHWLIIVYHEKKKQKKKKQSQQITHTGG